MINPKFGHFSFDTLEESILVSSIENVDIKNLCIDNYRYYYEAGAQIDSPSLPFPKDGRIMINGHNLDDSSEVFGVQSSDSAIYWVKPNSVPDFTQYYRYDFAYYPGKTDLLWIEAKKKNYFNRLQKEERLAELEPDEYAKRNGAGRITLALTKKNLGWLIRNEAIYSNDDIIILLSYYLNNDDLFIYPPLFGNDNGIGLLKILEQNRINKQAGINISQIIIPFRINISGENRDFDHWVLVIVKYCRVRERIDINYFDPLGNPIPQCVQKIINEPEIFQARTTTTRILQSQDSHLQNDSNTSGAWLIEAAKTLISDEKLPDKKLDIMEKRREHKQMVFSLKREQEQLMNSKGVGEVLSFKYDVAESRRSLDGLNGVSQDVFIHKLRHLSNVKAVNFTIKLYTMGRKNITCDLSFRRLLQDGSVIMCANNNGGKEFQVSILFSGINDSEVEHACYESKKFIKNICKIYKLPLPQVEVNSELKSLAFIGDNDKTYGFISEIFRALAVPLSINRQTFFCSQLLSQTGVAQVEQVDQQVKRPC